MYPPYNRSNEGLVYLGLPQLLKSDYSLSDHQFLVTYLCLFVAIDLLVYHYYHDQYPTFKEKFNIPKFEYGLTNTFYFPETIYQRKAGVIPKEVFEDAFKNFINFFKTNNFEIEIKEILQKALSDKDFQIGKFNNQFLSFITKKLK